jgi:glycosyltransferase involved in cell wall biosynthesis/SAM-dependent methyltransferase
MSGKFDKSVYNEQYYTTSFGGIPYNREAHNGHWPIFFNGIAKSIVEIYKPARVLDVGCAKGFLVEGLRDLGVSAFGFDVSDVAISELREDIKPYCRMGSIDDPTMYEGQYDFITCIEVLEHVPEEMAQVAVELMCKNTSQVLFSSSPSDFDEPTHINVQPPSYWDNLFSKFGFTRAHEEWPSQVVAPHTIMYRKGSIEELVIRVEKNGFDLKESNIELQGIVKESNIELQGIVKESNIELQGIVKESNIELQGIVKENKIELQGIAKESNTELLKAIKESNEGFKDIINESNNSVISILKELAYQLDNTQKEKDYLISLVIENQLLKNQIQDADSNLKDEINNLLIKNNEIQNENVIVNSQLTELQKKENDLQNNLTYLNMQITQLNDQISRIKNGKFFKLLSKYWRVRDKVLPLGSNRREMVKAIVGRKKSLTTVAFSNESASTPINIDLWNEGYKEWLINSDHPDKLTLMKQLSESENFKEKPLVSILLPVYKIPLNIFKETINSVLDQSYPDWELCIALADLENPELTNYLSDLMKYNSKIKVVFLDQNGGISKNTNECLKLAKGEFIALLDHDDFLTPNALFEMVKAVNDNKDADFLYSDKDQINEDRTTRLNPLFKHRWSWVTMLSANYPTHFCVIRRSLFTTIGWFDPTTDGAQDWDIFLKVSEHARNIVHVPAVLYHWRIISTSVASGLQAKPYVVEAQNKTIENYLKRNKLNAIATRNENHTFRLNWQNDKQIGYDSVIYLNTNDNLQDVLISLNSLKEQLILPTTVFIISDLKLQGHFDHFNPKFNVVCLDMENKEEHLSETFIFKQGTESCILFIKAGIKLNNKEYAQATSLWVTEGNYPAVSGKIMNPSGLIVNAGYVFHNRRLIEPFKGMSTSGYTTYGSADWYREYLAVSEYALMIDKSLFKGVLSQIKFNGRIEETLIKAQVQLSLETNRSVLYDPYLVCEINKYPDIKIFDYGNDFTDYYYNRSVWDWNPSYLNSRFVTLNQAEQKQAAPSIWSGYTSDAMILATLFDFNHDDLEKNQKTIELGLNSDNVKSAIWFLPPFSTAFYGGIHTILRFAEYLSINHSIKNSFVIVGAEETYSVKNAIKAAFPSLYESEVYPLSNDNKINHLPQSDISFCTLWTTAYSLLKYNNTSKKYYFLQDWEPLFYPGGTTSAQVEATYRFGFEAVCNTISLKLSYEEVGGKAINFTPAVDTTVFYPATDERIDDVYKVFLYGRPGNPRNCFELAIPALKKVKQHFGKKVRILSAGADWDAAEYGAEGVIEHLGMLPYKETGNLYRQCHVGLAMMMTRHPSYLPFEMMACGCLVVANKNTWNEWMLQDNFNCKVSEPSVSCISETIIEYLEDGNKRREIANSAANYIKNERSNWDMELQNITNWILTKR